jgi:hypothetical protein
VWERKDFEDFGNDVLAQDVILDAIAVVLDEETNQVQRGFDGHQLQR